MNPLSAKHPISNLHVHKTPRLAHSEVYNELIASDLSPAGTVLHEYQQLYSAHLISAEGLQSSRYIH